MREVHGDSVWGDTGQHVRDLPVGSEGGPVDARGALGHHACYWRVAVPCRDRATGNERAWPGSFTADSLWLEDWEDQHDIDPPPFGDLTPALADALVHGLADGRHDQRCLFATWTGYADLRGARDIALVLPPGREMLAVTGRLAEVHDVAERLGRYPVRWFSAEATWAVGADIYARSIIVAGRDRRGPFGTVADLLSTSPLRAVAVDGTAPLPTFPA